MVQSNCSSVQGRTRQDTNVELRKRIALARSRELIEMMPDPPDEVIQAMDRIISNRTGPLPFRELDAVMDADSKWERWLLRFTYCGIGYVAFRIIQGSLGR